MNTQAFTVLILPIIVCIVYSTIELLLAIRKHSKYLSALTHLTVANIEKELSESLLKEGIQNKDGLASKITKLGYKITHSWLPVLQRIRGNKIFLWKLQSDEKINFKLAYTLANLIYQSNNISLAVESFGRFSKPQVLTYMADAILLPEKEVWPVINQVDYQRMTSEQRKIFVMKLAYEYKVETTVVFRRVSELLLLHKEQNG